MPAKTRPERPGSAVVHAVDAIAEYRHHPASEKRFGGKWLIDRIAEHRYAIGPCAAKHAVVKALGVTMQAQRRNAINARQPILRRSFIEHAERQLGRRRARRQQRFFRERRNQWPFGARPEFADLPATTSPVSASKPAAGLISTLAKSPSWRHSKAADAKLGIGFAEEGRVLMRTRIKRPQVRIVRLADPPAAAAGALEPLVMQ
jgi:hypothetical protein